MLYHRSTSEIKNSQRFLVVSKRKKQLVKLVEDSFGFHVMYVTVASLQIADCIKTVVVVSSHIFSGQRRDNMRGATPSQSDLRARVRTYNLMSGVWMQSLAVLVITDNLFYVE